MVHESTILGTMATSSLLLPFIELWHGYRTAPLLEMLYRHLIRLVPGQAYLWYQISRKLKAIPPRAQLLEVAISSISG